MELSRREYLVLLATAPLAGAKNAAPRIACQCYVFEQAYGQKQQKTLDTQLEAAQQDLANKVQTLQFDQTLEP